MRNAASFLNIYYDDARVPKTVSYGFGKIGNLTPLTKAVRYQYDNADRMTSVKDWLNNVTTYNYGYIPLNNSVKTTYTDGSVISYRYDSAGRLETILDVKADSSLNAMYKYGFDALGNRTTIASYQPQISIPTPPDTSYTHDDDNRMLTAGITSFAYDDNGNLMGETGGTIATYTWNYGAMLTQVVNGVCCCAILSRAEMPGALREDTNHEPRFTNH